MSAYLLVAFTALGLTLELDGDHLRARPRDLLTPGVRRLIAYHRTELIAALTTGPPTDPDLDPEIVSSVDQTWDPEKGCRRRLSIDEMQTRLARIIERYAATRDPVWLEAAWIWTAAIQQHIPLESIDAPPNHHKQDRPNRSSRLEAA